MSSQKQAADPATPPRAGGIETFTSGKLTFLSPKPLPTGAPPNDFAHAVGEIDDGYLDFGTGWPSSFAWQFTFGLPLWGFLLCSVIIPFVGFLGGHVYGNGWPEAIHAFWGVLDLSFWIGLWGGVAALAITLSAWWGPHRKRARIIPTRFNRQRREVCIMPEGYTKPVFVPWEELVAWITEAQGVTEYGVQRQAGMGVGFDDPDTGRRITLEVQSPAVPLAISNWEALRAYMEYEVHTRKDIQDPEDLQGPDDPPWEGLHVFRNLQERIRRRRREGDIGWIYTAFWHLWQLLHLWSIPYRLVDWEVGRIKRMNKKALPEAMQQWSEPLPESEWAKPSEELIRLSKQVRDRQKANPGQPVTEIFAEVVGNR